jgi:ribosomal-protein-alanine N-acetyltransferase
MMATMQVVPRLAIEPMRHDDIPSVQAIERDVFPSTWPKNAYASELNHNRHALYIVLRNDNAVAGYAGLWRVGQEAHVTTIGVRRQDQGRGYGSALFCALLQRAYELDTSWVTLEVRLSNMIAIHMYERFGFKSIGRRRAYYTDNGEDAVVMWSDCIHAPRFKQAFVDRLGKLEITGVGTPPSAEYPYH